MLARGAFVSLAAAALLIGVGLSSCAPPSELSDELERGQFAVRQKTHTWRDTTRQRTIPVRLYVPDADGPFPLIVFSPGLGGSRDHYASLGQYWASHGFLAIFLTHPDAEDHAIYGDGRPIEAMLEIIGTPAHEWHYPADLAFVLDAVEQDESLANLIDSERIGVAGHSYGAFAALALAGLRADYAGRPGTPFLDPRVKAVVAMSPPVPGALGLGDNAWDQIGTPCMTLMGTLDMDLTNQDPMLRRATFVRCPGPDQYLVTLLAATHGVFDDQSPWLVDQLSYPYHHAHVKLATVAFFMAYLKGDADAQAWLLGGALELLSEGTCTLEFKHITPIEDDATAPEELVDVSSP